MKRVIDIHSHILPRVDDGCRNRVEALAMLAMYEQQNVEAVICTPHYGPCGFTGADVNGAFEWLRSRSPSVDLYLGNEADAGYFDGESINAPTGPRTLAGSNALLVEFDEWGSTHVTEEELIKGLSYLDHFFCDVILAHPERYKIVQDNPEICRKIAKMGIKMQINAYDVYETKTDATRILTQWMLENQLVSYIGSDAHGAKRRAPALQSGVLWIYDHCPEDYADAIVHDNAAKIIRGEA